MACYIGRFAPTPTGPLHMGSLLAALISYLDARANNGQWLVRIEDIDPPREQAGATNLILQCLTSHGLKWDQTPVFQSQRSELYEKNLATLKRQNACYLCPCSRQELKALDNKHKQGCGFYSSHGSSKITPAAIRFRSTNEPLNWQDCFLGDKSVALDGDFVLKRKDDLYAYQLAVISDDIAQGITHVIRGNDLTDSTPMQLALFKALGHEPPEYGHFPVIVGEDNKKLSKQNLSPAANTRAAISNLVALAKLIGISLPTSVNSPEEALGYCVLQ
jgi:glutamyl-Q tRNA(Asp) synthetase